MTTETRSTGEILFDHPTSHPAPPPSAVPATPAPVTPAAAPAEGPAEGPRKSDAAVLYGDPATVAASYAPTLRDSVNRAADVTGLSAAEAAEHLSRVARVFHEAGIEPGRAAILHARIVAGVAEPPDDAARARAAVAVRRQLRERLGPQAADAALAGARAYVTARPTLAALLEASGAGNDLDVVLAFAEAARRRRGGGGA